MRTDSPFSTSGSPGRYRISTWSNTTCKWQVNVAALTQPVQHRNGLTTEVPR